MNDQESKRSSIKAVSKAALGLLFIVIYFFLVTHSPSVSILKPKFTKKKFIVEARKIFKSLNLKARRGQFQESYDVRINDRLYRYAQFYKNKQGEYPAIPLGYWRMEWRAKSAGLPDNRQWSSDVSVTYDFHGNLIGFQTGTALLKLTRGSLSNEEDAYFRAIYFLEGLNINTSSLFVVKKDRKETPSNRTRTYNFTLQEKKNDRFPYLRKQYRFLIVNEVIAGFDSSYIADLEAIGGAKSPLERMVTNLLLVATWLGIFIILVVNFVKKLRRDELEFRRALGVGLGVGGLVLATMSVAVWGSWGKLLASGGIGGAFVLLIVLIVFPIADSRAREIWPEKLELMDILLRRKGMVRETGLAILNAIFITGVSLLFLGGVIFLFPYLGTGYLSFGHERISGLLDFSTTLSQGTEAIIVGVLAGFLLLVFWPSFLRIKLRSGRGMFILLMVLTFEFTGLFLLFINPVPAAAVLLLPIALAGAYFVLRYDMVTTILGLIGLFFFIQVGLVFLMPENLFSAHGVMVGVVLLLMLTMGVFLAFRKRSVKDYDSYIPDYVARIAERERFLKELEIARGVQMRFLPQKVPEFPSLEIVSLCQPAMEVGGDYYDFIQMDARHMSVLIGDVSGKGVSAAFYMTMVKGIIKTLSKKTREPATLLAEANEIFYENAPREVFITIIYGIFDLQEQVLKVASAGHNPLIVWRKETGKTEFVNPRGMALGLDRGNRYREIIQEKRIPIEEGDVVVFYTDGVTEAMNMEQEVYGEERLINIIERFARLTPGQLQERIVNDVSRFSGKAPQHDDFTMVVVKVKNKILGAG